MQVIKKCKPSTGNNVAQLERTANSRWKMVQSRTTGPYHKSFQTLLDFFFSFFFQSCWLEVSDIFWPSNFTSLLSWVRIGAVILSPPLLRGGGGVALRFQDTILEDSHDGGTDQAGDGHSHEPRHEDVSEQTPVYRLP